jgi:hypothetical protein
MYMQARDLAISTQKANINYREIHARSTLKGYCY